MITLAVDMMGGDTGLTVTVPACEAFLNSHPHARLILVGDEKQIRAHVQAKNLINHPRIRMVHACEVVAMDDAVEVALRRKKDSSMRVAINQVKDGDAQAAISAGNTGALMAIARFVLKTIDDIDRPAIASIMPNLDNTGTTVLDLGANVDCTAEHLQQFALMGSALVSATQNISTPRVGLLNIGHEDIKGNEVVKQAAVLLKDTPINFIGNVEGDSIFMGGTDVIVCDGFVGNVLLKTAEGLTKMIRTRLMDELTQTWWRRAGAAAAMPALNAFRDKIDNRRYNGAALLGLRGVVFKSHGGADAYAFGFALQRAYDAVANDMLNKTTQMLLQMNNKV
ncbi:phosphate acyltransferase PlsX [Hydromonas duriensis]|uniref:phosphate acyltransferase PlsX n=1 Tax=Hydromonas duriensis TaxID=1527608 RepID=UPI00105E299B|nr:phosphate acyltransferase PlsX [Hydromonas duriensis]